MSAQVCNAMNLNMMLFCVIQGALWPMQGSRCGKHDGGLIWCMAMVPRVVRWGWQLLQEMIWLITLAVPTVHMAMCKRQSSNGSHLLNDKWHMWLCFSFTEIWFAASYINKVLSRTVSHFIKTSFIHDIIRNQGIYNSLQNIMLILFRILLC